MDTSLVEGQNLCLFLFPSQSSMQGILGARFARAPFPPSSPFCRPDSPQALWKHWKRCCCIQIDYNYTNPSTYELNDKQGAPRAARLAGGGCHRPHLQYFSSLVAAVTMLRSSLIGCALVLLSCSCSSQPLEKAKKPVLDPIKYVDCAFLPLLSNAQTSFSFLWYPS